MSGVPLPAAASVATLAARFGGEPDSAALGQEVCRVVAPSDATEPGELVLVVSRRVLERAREAPGIFLTTPAFAAELPRGRRWIHAHALWVLCELVSARDPGADPLIGERTQLGKNAVVMPGAELGSDCVIEPGAVIYGRVKIGDRVVIGANAVIGRAGFGWTHAPTGKLTRVPQLGGVEIEDDVEIGALCTVDAGTLGPTKIRRGAKLDAQVHVGHNVEIGAHTLIAAQSGFAGSVKIGERVRIGGQSGVADHVSIGDGAQIAAKSGVIGDIPSGAVVAGFPAVSRMRWLRAMARLLERK